MEETSATRHPLYPLAARLRPGLQEMNNAQRIQAFAEVLVVISVLPIALLSLAWLAWVTPVSALFANWLPLVLLTFGLAIVNRLTTTMMVELEPQKYVRVMGSLSGLILWASLFAWGPVALWAEVFANLFIRMREGWRRGRFNQNMFWMPLASYSQDVSTLIPGTLLGLMAYRALGGTTPFNPSAWTDWLGPFAAVMIASIVPAFLALPLMTQISRLANIPVTAFSVRAFMFSVVVLGLVPTPFAIPLSLLYTRAGWGPFVFGLVGVVLVNWLANSLSKSNERTQQQSREMTQLEKLGEEILQAPPDGSTLMEILQKQIAAMFVSPLDMIEVRVFDALHRPGLAVKEETLRLVHPADATPLPDSAWQELQWRESDHQILKNFIPLGMKEPYGDAILVKILDAAPASNGTSSCIGGISLLRHKDEARTIDSLPTIQAFASQIASAIYRAQVHDEALAAAKMTQELAFAGTIQASFLPESVPVVEGWSLAASLIPARQTSGDFYDFIQLPNGKLGLLAADVADKGTGAALYMALSRTLIRTFALQYPDQPEEAFCRANERILADSRADQFVTVFYAVLDPATGTFVYCNAGHNPPLLLRGHHSQTPEMLSRTGVALGAMDGLTWKSRTLIMEHDDVLVLYTDGVTDAQNTTDEFFGEPRLIASARSRLEATAEDIHATILNDLRRFVGNAPQFDDITLIVIKRE